MSQKLSRRSFLKTAGAVAVAAAAMSTLTACGGGGSSTPDSKPTPLDAHHSDHAGWH